MNVPVVLTTRNWSGKLGPIVVPLGRVYAHAVEFDQAIALIADRIGSGAGGYVVTPNVDHVCLAERDEGLRGAYRDAWLALPDGMPLLWIAAAAGTPLPEKVSGSDLMLPLMRRAARDGLRVALLGSTPEISARAATRAQEMVPGLQICARECPAYQPGRTSPELQASIARLRASAPHVIFVALSVPRQELFMQEYAGELGPAVLIGIGGSLDFLAGVTSRAPAWMQRNGLEWFYRLMMDPRRLAGRYLVRDWLIAPIAVRTIVRTRTMAWRRRRDQGPR